MRSVVQENKAAVEDIICCGERAIVLSRMINSQEKFKKIENILTSLFELVNKDKFPFWNLSDIIIRHKKDNISDNIAKKLEILALEFCTSNEFEKERDCYNAAQKWYARLNNETKETELIICIAESFVKSAENSNSALKKSHFYGEALKKYQTIPNLKRTNLQISDRINEIYISYNTSTQSSLDELCLISTEEIDISHFIKKTQDNVRGKNFDEALKAIVGLPIKVNVDKIFNKVQSLIKMNPLFAIFPQTILSHDGRIAAKHSGINFEKLDQNNPAIYQQMINNYLIYINICVQANILPALEIFQIEHTIYKRTLVELAMHSSFIPQDRATLWGKGLFAGFEYDFVTAIHILIPQIEHTVRYLLKAQQAKTTTIDSNGIETENGLSSLMSNPKTTQILGDNLAFEFQSLFCNSFGPNLRNEIAHGLLSAPECYSPYAIYTWWLALKLTYLSSQR